MTIDPAETQAIEQLLATTQDETLRDSCRVALGQKPHTFWTSMLGNVHQANQAECLAYVRRVLQERAS